MRQMCVLIYLTGHCMGCTLNGAMACIDPTGQMCMASQTISDSLQRCKLCYALMNAHDITALHYHMCYPTRENIINIATYIQIYTTHRQHTIVKVHRNNFKCPMRIDSVFQCGPPWNRRQNEVEHAGTQCSGTLTTPRYVTVLKREHRLKSRPESH